MYYICYLDIQILLVRGSKMKLFSYLKKYIFKYKSCFIKFIFFNLVYWALTIVTPYISGKYIDVLIYTKTRNVVYLFSILILFINIFNMIISYLKDVTYTRLLNNVIFKLSVNIYDHLKKVSFQFYKSKDSVYLSKRINDDSNALADFCIQNSILFFLNIFSIILSFIILFRIDKFIALLLIVTIPVYIFIYNKFKDKLYESNYLYKEKLNNYHSRIAEQFINIKFIQINVLFKETNNRLKYSYKEFFNFLIKFFRFNYFFSNASLIVLRALNAVVICYGGLKVIEGKISVGEFTIISTYFTTIMTSINYFITLSSSYQQALVSYDRLKELEDEPIQVNGSIVIEDTNTICLNNIRFSYHKESKPLLKITTSFKKGNIYCIKGANGIGKSSLLNLMVGLYPDYDGEITYNHNDLKMIDCYRLRQEGIGIVIQEPSLIKGSILDNLRYGLEDIEFEKIIYWCKRFDIYNMINNLPEKFNTIISENAGNLSGGEKQKISIIRILLKNSPILIFDEPTSALDYNSINIFSQVLNTIKKTKIILIITHDDKITKIADNVINI